MMIPGFTAAECAVLRRSAAQYRLAGETIGDALRRIRSKYFVLRDEHGRVSGWGREGFVATPKGVGLYTWHERRQWQSHVNSTHK